MSKYRFCWIAIFFLIFISNPILSVAENSAIITKIVIKGNERVSVNTILSYAEVKEGDIFSTNLTSKIIKRLGITVFL